MFFANSSRIKSMHKIIMRKVFLSKFLKMSHQTFWLCINVTYIHYALCLPVCDLVANPNVTHNVIKSHVTCSTSRVTITNTKYVTLDLNCNPLFHLPHARLLLGVAINHPIVHRQTIQDYVLNLGARDVVQTARFCEGLVGKNNTS